MGADGVYFIDTSPSVAVAQYFNSDGSPAEYCGNGLRCVGRWLAEKDDVDRTVVVSGGEKFEVDVLPPSSEGVHNISVRSERPVRLMRFGASGTTLRSAMVPELSRQLRFTAFNGPNPHLVACVENYDEDLLRSIGETANADRSRFAHGINTSFVLPVSSDGRDFYVRTFERGVGFTPSCASGAAAAAALLALDGLAPIGEPIRVRNNGGPLTITIHGDEDNLYPTQAGNATYVYAASVDVGLIVNGSVKDFALEAFLDEMQAVDTLWWKNARHLEDLGVNISVDV